MKSGDVILALVRLHPGVSGYELRQQIKLTSGYFFSISLSRLYPLLAELTKRGFLTFTEEEILRRPPRKRYTITELGEKHLEDVMVQEFDPEFSMQAFSSFLGQLSLMPTVDDDVIRSFLLDGKRVFTEHRERIMRSGMSDAEDYVASSAPDRDRFVDMWRKVNKKTSDDLERHVEWIDEMLDSFDAS